MESKEIYYFRKKIRNNLNLFKLYKKKNNY